MLPKQTQQRKKNKERTFAESKKLPPSSANLSMILKLVSSSHALYREKNVENESKSITGTTNGHEDDYQTTTNSTKSTTNKMKRQHNLTSKHKNKHSFLTVTSSKQQGSQAHLCDHKNR